MAKVLVTIEDNLLKRIDRSVRDRGLTRSAYVSELARRDLDAQLGPGADPAVHAALDRLQQLGREMEYATDEDVVSLLRRTRDERLERFS
jgi:DNA-binding phage protein